jgi:hypothetical protein
MAGFDEIIDKNAPDFSDSGLKETSIIRVGRLAVVEGFMLLNAIKLSFFVNHLRSAKPTIFVGSVGFAPLYPPYMIDIFP